MAGDGYIDQMTADEASGHAEAAARSSPHFAAMVPRGTEELFYALFGKRAATHPRPDDLLTPTGRLRRWASDLGAACAAELRPYSFALSRGLDPGSLAALSRVPTEILRMGEWPTLDRLAPRLEHLADTDPAVVEWSELWEMWVDGGGEAEPYRIPGVLEALGWGMEPDPRLGPPVHPVVALFMLPPGPTPDRTPAREAVPVMALAAPVLAATGVVFPPLPMWVRLVAISEVEATDAPRMEAHLAFRAAVRMRPGPVRRRLRDLPPRRVERLWSVLRDLAAAGGPPSAEAMAALDRAGSLLGFAPPDPLGDLPNEEGARPSSVLRLVSGGDRGHRRRGDGGGVPSHVKEAFAEWVVGGCRGDRLVVGVLGTERPLQSVLRSVAGCSEPLPAQACDVLRLEEGETYADAARLVTRLVLEGTLPNETIDELNPDEEVDEFLARLGPQDDRYDPSEPLANLGWPVVIRGRLYRVDDEILIGLEGQPDLPWDDFDPGEARPAPPDVIGAELQGSP